MSDLSEALDPAKHLCIPGPGGWQLSEEGKLVLAAARKWEALENPTDELIERVADAIMDEPGFEWQGLNDPEVKDHLTLTCRDAARAAVDALTVTAEPEDG